MNDMSSVIVPKSDQINADDLIGRNMTITIRDVQIRGGQEQPVSIYFEGSDKAFRPCKSMSRVLVYCWGADAKQYIGRSLTLYRDPNVKWGGMAVGGIRISHASHIDGEKVMVLAESKASRKPYTVKPLKLAERQADTGPTVEDAAARLRGAFDLDELRTIWSGKAMAPFRDQLGDVLAEMKTTLGAAANPNEGAGESATPLDDWLDRIAAATDIDTLGLAVDAARADHGEDERIYAARDARLVELKGAK